jgi:heme A synthase
MGNRLVTGGFGLLLIVLAVAIAIVSDAGWPGRVAALVVGVLGIEALYSAARNRRSLISRIGPLP